MSHTEHETPQGGNLAHEERASQVELAMLLSKVQETNKALARSNVESAQIIAQLEDTKGLRATNWPATIRPSPWWKHN